MFKNQINLTLKQAQLIKALQTRRFRYLLFGGGMGGGKSYILAFIIISFARYFPNTRYGVFRKNLTVLKRTTYQTFLKVLNDFHYSYRENKAEMYIELAASGSRIYFIEADESKDSDFNKLKGLELTAAGIDEANEIAEKAFNIIMARIGRQNNGGIFGFILLTCNPDNNWVLTRFYEPFSKGQLQSPYYFIQALAKDNPFLSNEYLEALNDLPEVEFNRYVLGDWRYSDDPNQLIRFEWIKRNLIQPGEVVFEPEAMAVDVARYGDDRTAFGFRKESSLIGLKSFKNFNTVEVGDMVIKELQDNHIGAEKTCIDVVGVGGGVVDYVRSKKFFVHAYNSGSQPTASAGHLQYKNQRAQSYYEMREGLMHNDRKIIDDKGLIKELLSIRYTVKDKVIQIESKEEVKKRLGYSTDLADVAVMSYYKPRELVIGSVPI